MASTTPLVTSTVLLMRISQSYIRGDGMVAPVSGFETGQTAVVHEVEHLDAVFEDHHVGDEAPVTRAANSSRSRRP
jgi:hypothetical protein